MNTFCFAQNFHCALTAPDYIILAASVLLLGVITYFSGRGQTDTNDFFVGQRHIPSWAACLSFVATEVSALTVVGVPATAFKENWQYMQFVIGSAVARVVIAYLFIPVFYKYRCVTIYEYLRHRFGPETQYTGSAFFFIGRLLGSGVRLYAACLAVGLILGWNLWLSIVFFTIFSIAFIAFGGIKAVVWTGVISTFIFYLAGFAVLGFLMFNLHGSFHSLFAAASAAGKLSFINWGFNIIDPNIVWMAVLNGLLVSMASFGTDQELMQRMLTVETRQSSQKALVSTILGSVPLTILYMAVGTGIYMYFTQHPALPLPDNSDKILAHFTNLVLPAGLRGLVLAAIILASMHSPLGSLSSSFVTDIYRTLIRRGASEKHYLLVSRISVGVFGLILAVLAYMCSALEGILWFAFKITAVTAGSMLGVFLLGMLTGVRVNKMNVVSMILNSVVMTILLVLSEKHLIGLGWSWLILFGTAGTIIVSMLLAKYEHMPPKTEPEPLEQD